MKTPPSDWTYNQFLAYLLLYVAHSDTQITDEEKEMIFARAGTHNYHDVKIQFDHANDYDRLQVILGFRETYFPDDYSKKKLLNDMYDLLLSDYEYSVVEKSFFLFIRRLLAG